MQSIQSTSAREVFRKHPWLIVAIVVALVTFAILAWLALNDFGKYQIELRDASRTSLDAPTGKDVRELDIQEHIAGFIYGQLLFSAFGLVVSFGALIFLGWTLKETRSMALETRRMVTQSAVDADEARRINHAQYRAYLRAEEAHIQHRGGRWELRVRYKNDGQSPALCVHHKARVRTRNLTVSEPAPMDFGGSETYHSKRPVAPGASDTYTYPVPSYPDASDVVRNGQAVTFVGDVIYQDIFGKWLRTEFEFYLDEKLAVLWTAKPSEPAKLTWGRRGPGGVYEMIDLPKEPPDVQALIVKLDKQANVRERSPQVPN